MVSVLIIENCGGVSPHWSGAVEGFIVNSIRLRKGLGYVLRGLDG